MRRDDWKIRLIQHLGEVARTPYQVGQNDCALFAARAVAAMTDVDLAAEFIGRYRTIRGGIRILRKAGYADHIDLAAAHFDEVATCFAAAGDLAVVPGLEGEALGVVQGEVVYVLSAAEPDRSLAVVPLALATRTFRV
jgi:SpoU rRNA methylase family enzyme